MFSRYLCLLLIGVLAGVNGDTCGEVTLMTDFDMEKYLGMWYMQSVHPESFKGKCIRGDFKKDENGKIMLHHAGLDEEGKADMHVGEMVRTADDMPKFQFEFHNMTIPNWMVACKYDKYAISYTCREKDGKMMRYAVILTRDQMPSEAVMMEAKKAMDDAKMPGITSAEFMTMDQTNCDALKM